MAYITLPDLKDYLGISTATDDSILTSLIGRAQGIIEAYTGRKFEAESATHYFTNQSIEGRYLYLWGYDLLTITALTNGNGIEITSANYRLVPRNDIPKWAIRLGQDANWEMDDGDSEISVAGTWGYSTTAPNDIVHACTRLAAFLYRQKDTSADIDRPMITGDGVTIMPSALPQDIKSLLNKYQRRII